MSQPDRAPVAALLRRLFGRPGSEDTAEAADPDAAAAAGAATGGHADHPAQQVPPMPPVGTPFPFEQAPYADPEEFQARLARFGILHEGNRDYFLTHLQRYRVTLGLLAEVMPAQPRILELGGAGLAFTLLLRDVFPDAQITIAEYNGGLGQRQLRIVDQQTAEPLTFQAHSFNIESDPWPFDDGQFDLVLCMEIIEHLMLDPYFIYCEARRVLRPGGHFLVTTPNIASAEGVDKLLSVESPYLFGIYSRHGAYGRHNREFTPWEISGLGERAGLQAAKLITCDVYPPSRDVEALWQQLGEALEPMALRGQNTFYLGRRGEGEEDAEPGAYPEFLFDFDPREHLADITVQRVPASVAAGAELALSVQLANRGSYTWQPHGEGFTRFRVMLLNEAGELIDREHSAVSLPQPVAPGESLDLDCTVPAPAAPGHYQLRLDMVHEQVCWFSEMRSAAVDLPLRVDPA